MQSLPPFNEQRHYLGALCKRGHDWHGSGKSLRLRSDRHCLDCVRERQAPTLSERTKRRYDEYREFVDRIKLERGCSDCGYRGHPAALQFDHLPGLGKRQIIARMGMHGRDSLLQEMEKCEVVCANCHSIRTFERRR